MEINSTSHKTPRPRTALQVAASRTNGAKSRGPVTEEGKRRSSRNAVTHGVLSSDILISGESLERFLQLSLGVLRRFDPSDEVELAFAQSFIMARWRQRRAWDIESVKMNCEIAAHPGLTPPLAAAKAWDEPSERSRAFPNLLRYERSHRRDMSRCVSDIHFTRLALPSPPGADDEPDENTAGEKVEPVDLHTARREESDETNLGSL